MLKPTGTNRKFYLNLKIDSYKSDPEDYTPSHPTSANLVSSLCEDGPHRPALDLDLGAELYPSSHPGHFHLYIDKALAWDKYRKLLQALAEAGIIEQAYVDHSLARGQTMLRLPHIKKKEHIKI